jgi:hypothetical protein
MILERGDRVIFTRNAGCFLWPVPKGKKGTVTRAGWWWPNIEVTLESEESSPFLGMQLPGSVGRAGGGGQLNNRQRILLWT